MEQQTVVEKPDLEKLAEIWAEEQYEPASSMVRLTARWSYKEGMEFIWKSLSVQNSKLVEENQYLTNWKLEAEAKLIEAGQAIGIFSNENEELKAKLKVKESFCKRFEELNERYLTAKNLMGLYHTEKEFLSKRNEVLKKDKEELSRYLSELMFAVQEEDLERWELPICFDPQEERKELWKRAQKIKESIKKEIESLLSSVNKEENG